MKYVGIVIGMSGLIITLLATFAADSNNKKGKAIQPKTESTDVAAASTAAAAYAIQKSELEKERY